MLQTIGSIIYNPCEVIGRGSTSIVYRGNLGKRQVAIKKVEKRLVKVVQSEITQLETSDGHKNIIRYFLKEEDKDFYYIALELCVFTLKDYVVDTSLKRQISLKTIIENMIDGMKWLHQMSIVHRDIKPTNVLLLKNPMGELELKISDFGFAKQLDASGSQMSIVPEGSNLWTVPEISSGKYNFKSDVYSMGCLVYYLASNGSITTRNDLVDFFWNASVDTSCEGVLLRHLVQAMTMPGPEYRPTFACLRCHPLFWETQKVLNFVLAVADRLKNNDNQAYAAKNNIQEGCSVVFGSNWETSLEQETINSLAYRRPHHNYGTGSISELLRAIRNKAAHYDEMSMQAKAIYGPMPEGFTNYWIGKFPKLLIHLYVRIATTGLRSDENFSNYYPSRAVCENL